MKIHLLEREQIVPRTLDEAFAFFERPENLALITPPRLGFVILTPAPIVMHRGTLIDYTIRQFGLPIRWTTLISDYDPPHKFVDQQIRGPYSFWHHTHLFEPVEGGTRLIDQVRYLVPGGPGGVLLDQLYIRRALDRIFDYRAQVIGQQLGFPTLISTPE